MSIKEQALKVASTTERQKDYGKPLENFLRIALRWTMYLDRVVTPLDVAFMIVDMKIARQQNSYKEDNVVDILGYMICVSDMDEQMKELGYVNGVQDLTKVTVASMYDLLEKLTH